MVTNMRKTASIRIIAPFILLVGYGMDQPAPTSVPSAANPPPKTVVSTTVIRADNGILLPTGTEFRLLENPGDSGGMVQLTLYVSREAYAKHFREITEKRDFQVIAYNVLE